MSKSSEKLTPKYDVDRNAEHDKTHDQTVGRNTQSKDVATSLGNPKKDAGEIVKQSDLSPNEKEKALELVAPVAGGTGIPDGIAAIPYITKKLEHEILTNPDAANSRFMQGAYALFKIFGDMFGFAFAAGDYAAFTSALYPTERIEFKDEIQVKEFLSTREKLKLLKDYHKTKIELGATMDDGKKKDLQVELDKLKLDIKANFGVDGDDPDALYEKYLGDNKTALTEEELKKFKDTEHADAQASCYYVKKQLGILGLKKEGQDESFDPDALMASLNRSAYYEDPSAEYSTKFFKPENDFSKFSDSLDSGTLAPGTIMFFRWNFGEKKTETMCGVVGIDGKIRFQDSKKLHTFGRGKSDADKYADQLLGKSDREDDFDADLNELSFSLPGLESIVPVNSFVGAFIPKTIQGDPRPKKEEEKKDETAKTEEPEGETEEPEGEKKEEPAEAEKPKEEPKAQV